MKLNPPETAPKDGTVFLVCLNVGTPFSHELEFFTAFYEPAKGILYSYADIDDNFVEDEDEGPDSCRIFHTDNCTDDPEFIGWLPMPKFDGNKVTFCP